MKQLILAILFFTPWLAQANPAPDFTVTTTDGQVRHLYQDYVNQQKLVVIEFFFVACPPCAQHAPYWQTLYTNVQAAHPGKVEFLILSILGTDTNAKVAQYRTSKGLTMPGAGSDGGSTAAAQPYLSDQFGQFLGTPTFVVIAPGTGEVYFDISSNSPQATMDLINQKINQLLPPEPCFIKSFFNNPIDEVTLHIDAPDFDTSFVANGGAYALDQIASLDLSAYTISASKPDIAITGVSTIDLVYISKHILGLSELTEPWQLIAADVNCSGSITTYDIVQARKLILGVVDTLPCGPWVFVADPPSNTSSGSCVNLRGVKLGDLTGPYLQAPADDRGAVQLQFENPSLQAGERVLVPVSLSGATQLSGFQFSLSYDPEILQIIDIQSDILPGWDAGNFINADGVCSVSWSDGKGITFAENQPLMYLEVQALQACSLQDVLSINNDKLRAECYCQNGDLNLLGLQWLTNKAESSGVFVTPNPVDASFTLYFTQNSSQAVQIRIADLRGRIVWQKNTAAISGLNRVVVDDFQQPDGIYLVFLNGKPEGRFFKG